MKNKEVEELLDCSKCKLKECIGCDITYTDRKKIKEYIEKIEKIEKMIDLMAKYINKIDVSENICEGRTMCDENCEECIKQYFERKVRDVKD